MTTELAKRSQPVPADDASPLVGTYPSVAKLSVPAVAHREAFRAYVLAEAAPWHRQHLGRLYTLWEEWNAAYYEAAMIAPYILLNEPSTPKRYGSCGPVSGFGGQSQIRIRPSLLVGTHPHVRAGAAFAVGRFAFVADVLLHEMVHQWQQEVSGDRDTEYHGHGPAFRDRANVIGAALGLPTVRTCKARGKDADRPSCSQWPHNVRPGDFYGGAYIPPADHMTPTPVCFHVPTEPGALADALARVLTSDGAEIVARRLVRHFALDVVSPPSVPTASEQGAA